MYVLDEKEGVGALARLVDASDVGVGIASVVEMEGDVLHISRIHGTREWAAHGGRLGRRRRRRPLLGRLDLVRAIGA